VHRFGGSKPPIGRDPRTTGATARTRRLKGPLLLLPPTEVRGTRDAASSERVLSASSGCRRVQLGWFIPPIKTPETRIVFECRGARLKGTRRPEAAPNAWRRLYLEVNSGGFWLKKIQLPLARPHRANIWRCSFPGAGKIGTIDGRESGFPKRQSQIAPRLIALKILSKLTSSFNDTSLRIDIEELRQRTFTRDGSSYLFLRCIKPWWKICSSVPRYFEIRCPKNSSCHRIES